MRVSRPLLMIAFALLGSTSAFAEGDKDEIRIGQTLPYSGPASGFGIIGRAQEAYFEKINTEGGINGRKIKFISLDDAYSPPKTVEHAKTRRAGGSAADVRFARDRHQQRGAPLPQRQEGAAALRAERRDQMGRPEKFPLDHAGNGGLPV